MFLISFRDQPFYRLQIHRRSAQRIFSMIPSYFRVGVAHYYNTKSIEGLKEQTRALLYIIFKSSHCHIED